MRERGENERERRSERQGESGGEKENGVEMRERERNTEERW